jgi:hypothetical protein
LPLWALTTSVEVCQTPSIFHPALQRTASPTGLSAHLTVGPSNTNPSFSHHHVGPAGQPFLSPTFFLFLCRSPRDGIVGAGRPPRRPHGHHHPAVLAPRDGGHASPGHICTIRPCLGTLGRRPIKPPQSTSPIRHRLGISPCLPQEERRRGGEGEAGGEGTGGHVSPCHIYTIRLCLGTLGRRPIKTPQSTSSIRRRLGISPWPPQEERRRGGEGEAGGEETRGRPWENPRSPRRWTPTSLYGLQARPPEEGVPCVASANPERPEPGTPTPKPEPSVVKSPPRNRSWTYWRGSVVLLCSTAPSSPPCLGAQGEPQPPSPCCGPGLRAEAGPSHLSSLLVCCLLFCTAPPRRPAVA